MSKINQTQRHNYDNIAQQYLQSYDNSVPNPFQNNTRGDANQDLVEPKSSSIEPEATSYMTNHRHSDVNELNFYQTESKQSHHHQNMTKPYDKLVNMRDTKSHGPIKAPKTKKSHKSKYI